MSIPVTIVPGLLIPDNDPVTNAKLRQIAQPTGEVDPTAAQLQDIIANFATGRSIRSNDFATGLFYDGIRTAGSTTFTSATAAFTTADNGRLIVGAGIEPGTTATYVNGTTVALSQPAFKRFYDGVISGGTTLTSATAVFAPADTGRSITGEGIQDGTTVTYVSASVVTLSAAATNANAVTFQITGRENTIEFVIVGRGVGWRILTGSTGVGRVEDYKGILSSAFASGKLAIEEDGTITAGTGATRLTITPDGELFIGGPTFGEAIFAVAPTGDVIIQDDATTNHNIDTGAINPAVAPVSVSPAGGAIENPTTAYANCLTQYARIYYRVHLKDGVTNSDTSFVSSSGGFNKTHIGRMIAGTNIPANTKIIDVTNASTVVLSAATTGTGSSLTWHLIPTEADNLYGAALALTGTRVISFRAYKNGEWSPLRVYTFTLDAATTSNPWFSPVWGRYSTSTGAQTVTLRCPTLGSSIRYTVDGSTPTPSSGTLISPANGSTAPVGTASIIGTKTLKAIAYKGGLSNSAVVSGQYVVTVSGGGGTVNAVANPYFSPAPRSYTTADGTKLVTIRSTTLGATIRYTVDGSAPSPNNGAFILPANGSTAPVGSRTISGNKTIRAMAYKTGMSNSGTVTGTYVIAVEDTEAGGGEGGGNPGGGGGGGGYEPGGGGRGYPQ